MRTLTATYRGAEREIGRFAAIGEAERGRARAEADEADHRRECLTSGDAYDPTDFRIDPDRTPVDALDVSFGWAIAARRARR